MRKEEMDRVSAKRDAKVSRDPSKYVCSAKDCGIQATKKSGLLRCAGKCPLAFKPSYCSKECQKMVLLFYFSLLSPFANLLHRTGNGISCFVNPTLRDRAWIHSMPRAIRKNQPWNGRLSTMTLTLTSSKGEPRVIALRCR